MNVVLLERAYDADGIFHDKLYIEGYHRYVQEHDPKKGSGGGGKKDGMGKGPKTTGGKRYPQRQDFSDSDEESEGHEERDEGDARMGRMNEGEVEEQEFEEQQDEVVEHKVQDTIGSERVRRRGTAEGPPPSPDRRQRSRTPLLGAPLLGKRAGSATSLVSTMSARYTQDTISSQQKKQTKRTKR